MTELLIPQKLHTAYGVLHCSSLFFPVGSLSFLAWSFGGVFNWFMASIPLCTGSQNHLSEKSYQALHCLCFMSFSGSLSFRIQSKYHYIYIYPDQIQTSTSLLPDFLSCPCPHSVITLCLIHQVSHLTFPLIFSSSVNQFRQLLMICASPTGVAYPFKIFLKCHVYLLLFTTVGVCLRIIFLCSALKVG